MSSRLTASRPWASSTSGRAETSGGVRPSLTALHEGVSMSVADDLRAILDRANRDLDAVHDFFEHSKVVWQSLQTLVDEGHTITSQNRETGTAIDQDGLLSLAPHYTRVYLATFTFRQFVSSFEA